MLALLVSACTTPTSDDESQGSSEATSAPTETGADTDTETGGEPVPSIWAEAAIELGAFDCVVDLAPTSLVWMRSLSPSLEIYKIVEDHAGGVAVLGEDELGAVVLRLDADGALVWANRYLNGDGATMAHDIDSWSGGQLAVVFEGAASSVWRLEPDGTARWGHVVESDRTAQFVAFTGEDLVVALSGNGVVNSKHLYRLADSDGALLQSASDSVNAWLGLVDDTLGGVWVAYGSNGVALNHLNPDWESGSIADNLGIAELYDIDHDEDGELVVLIREEEMDLLRVVLYRFNGDAGGYQNLTYDYGLPRAMSLGPADDLVVGFEDTVAAWDTDANPLWAGTLECPEAIDITEVELDGDRRTWFAGRHGEEAFVGLIEASP